MADAYCGPSNALQNFQKHSSVDRTLQQDRLTSRRSPLDASSCPNFRSAEPNAGVLDPEFEAFQASQPGPLPFAEPAGLQFHQSLNQRGKQPVFGAPPGAVDWAADFQRLHVSPMPQQQQHLPTQPQYRNSLAPQLNQSNAGLSQYQFAPRTQQLQFQGQYGRLGGFGMAGQNMMQQGVPMQPPAMSSEAMGEFSDEAFARAFDAAAASMDIDNSTLGPSPVPYPHFATLRLAMTTMLLDPSEENIHRLAIYVTLLERHDMSQVPFMETRLWQPILTTLSESANIPYAQRYNLRERAAKLFDGMPQTGELPAEELLRAENAAKFYDSYFEKYKSGEYRQPTAKTSAAKDEELVADVQMQVDHLQGDLANKVLHSLPPDFAARLEPIHRTQDDNVVDEELAISPRAGTYLRNALNAQIDFRSVAAQGDQLHGHNDDSDFLRTAPILPQQTEQLKDQQQQDQQQQDDNDELARTANELLNKVQHDQSQKFQNSAFLGLMRRLRDREVKVEGDKMVETGSSSATVEPVRLNNGAPAAFASHPQNSTQSSNLASQPTSTNSNDMAHQSLRDGEDVVRLLDEPGTLDQDPEYTMTSPFYDNQNAELGRHELWQDYEYDA